MGLYWEYDGTTMGMKHKFHRREMAGNEVGLRLERDLKIKYNKNFNDKK